MSHPGASQPHFASLWGGYPIGLPGSRLSPLSGLRPSSAGADKGSVCYGRGQVQCGRPPIPPALQALIRQMARDNLTWGQQRIANELRLKLGLQVSPRTVRKYLPNGRDRGPGQRVQDQRWRTFMCNQAVGLLLSDLSTVLSQGVQVLWTRVTEFLTRWQSRFAAGPWWSATPSEAPPVFFTRPTRSLKLEDSAYPADRPRIADRSPPAIGHSHISAVMSAVTPVERSDWRPVESALDKRKLPKPNSGGAAPRCRGRNQADMLRRAA